MGSVDTVLPIMGTQLAQLLELLPEALPELPPTTVTKLQQACACAQQPIAVAATATPELHKLKPSKAAKSQRWRVKWRKCVHIMCVSMSH
jgi:hypothetical protein